jgi:hypothetical protein
MIIIRRLWISGLVFLIMQSTALAAEFLTQSEMNLVIDEKLKMESFYPSTIINGSISSIYGINADFATRGFLSIIGEEQLNIMSIPASITGTLSSNFGLTASLTTESGHIFLVTAPDAQLNGRARETQVHGDLGMAGVLKNVAIDEDLAAYYGVPNWSAGEIRMGASDRFGSHSFGEDFWFSSPWGSVDFSPVPVPAALPLMLTALGGLGVIRLRQMRRKARTRESAR